MNIEVLMQNIIKESQEVLVLYEASTGDEMETDCLSEEDHEYGNTFRVYYIHLDFM